VIFSTFERTVAFRYLRARRREGFVSVIAGFSLLGIALGVATLIIVMSVMNGFRAELFARVLGLNGHIAVLGSTGPLDDHENVATTVRNVPGVISVAPLVEGQVMATSNTRAAGALVRGVHPDDLRALEKFGDPNSVVIGRRLARRLGIRIGDRITLISPQGNISPFGSVPRQRGYRVIATFQVGMFEYDNTFVYMPLASAQRFLKLGQAVSNLEVMVRDPDDLHTMLTAIGKAVGPHVRLFDWKRANASFVSALEVERNVMFLILTLIIVVAAFNIISGLIMLVKDKGRDIAILRAMGATRGMIMRIFLLSGASVGVTGTILGFGLGMVFVQNIETIRRWLEGLTGTELFSAEIYFLSKLPAKVEAGEVASVVLMALVLSLLATWYPARRAGRIDPAEALRYE
jgi:lipoprotein-releasing system permease protein